MTDNTFSQTLALELGDLCVETYNQFAAHKQDKPWALPVEYQLLDVLYGVYEGDSLPLGFIAQKGTALYIAWRGTDDIEEWIQDAKCDQVSPSFFPDNIKVELGFHELYATADTARHPSPREVCLCRLAELSGIQRVYITGHSLGGALAVLNALDLASNSQLAVQPIVYTLAGPRVGNHDFAYAYNQRISNSWRVVNSHDEVPNLPPNSCPPLAHECHFEHVNSEKVITFGNSWNLPYNHEIAHYMAALQAGSGGGQRGRCGVVDWAGSLL